MKRVGRAVPGARRGGGPQSDVAQVTWRLEEGPDGVLERVRWERTPPDPEFPRSRTTDETEDAAVVRTVFSRRAAALNFRCFDGAAWLDAWEAAGEAGTAPEEEEAAAAGLPRAVEVTITWAAGGENAVAARGAGDTEAAPGLTLVAALPGAAAEELP